MAIDERARDAIMNLACEMIAERGNHWEIVDAILEAYEAAKPVAGEAVPQYRWRPTASADEWSVWFEGPVPDNDDVETETRTLYTHPFLAKPVAPMSTSGEMVENVARAIREAGMKREGSSKLTLGTVISEDLARAAIAASRIEALKSLVAEKEGEIGRAEALIQGAYESLSTYRSADMEKVISDLEDFLSASPTPPVGG